jgi:hypothetical protein
MMNSLCGLVAGFWLASLGIVAAEVHIFPVKIKCTLLTEDDAADAPVKLQFNQTALDDTDRLVLVIDDEENLVNLGLINSANEVEYIAESTHAAFLSNGQFGGNLVFESLTVINDQINATGTGGIHIKASFTVDEDTGVATLNKGLIYGVFNDSVNGNPVDEDGLLKGTIAPAGKEFDPDNVFLP